MRTGVWGIILCMCVYIYICIWVVVKVMVPCWVLVSYPKKLDHNFDNHPSIHICTPKSDVRKPIPRVRAVEQERTFWMDNSCACCGFSI